MVLAIGIGAGACTSSRPLAMPAEGAAHARGGDWFVQKGCTACHSISVYGVWNLAAQAPDLSLAVEDVPRRFGRPLEDFLREPTGTMAMVLSSRIRLSEADTRVAIEKLEEAYALHQRQRAMTGRPVSSHDDNGRVAQDLTPRGR
jgi:hypothetical protein